MTTEKSTLQPKVRIQTEGGVSEEREEAEEDKEADGEEERERESLCRPHQVWPRLPLP